MLRGSGTDSSRSHSEGIKRRAQDCRAIYFTHGPVSHCPLVTPQAFGGVRQLGRYLPRAYIDCRSPPSASWRPCRPSERDRNVARRARLRRRAGSSPVSDHDVVGEVVDVGGLHLVLPGAPAGRSGAPVARRAGHCPIEEFEARAPVGSAGSSAPGLTLRHRLLRLLRRHEIEIALVSRRCEVRHGPG